MQARMLAVLKRNVERAAQPPTPAAASGHAPSPGTTGTHQTVPKPGSTPSTL